MSTLVRTPGGVRRSRGLVRAAVSQLGFPQRAWYVVPGGAGKKNGRSWKHAFEFVQDGIDAAHASSVFKEVWVAAGTYTRRGVESQIANMERDVGLYGGFDGTERARADRDADVNIATLDGENTYRCIDGNNFTDVVIDGFDIIQGLGADGGGLSAASIASTTWLINDCHFSVCHATSDGGGIFASDATPTITNCTFTSCTAGADEGGGIHTIGISPIITGCTFTACTAFREGGGVFNIGGAAVITNCTFTGCSTTRGGGNTNVGGGMTLDSTNATVTGCTFTACGGAQTTFGGGIFVGGGSPTITGSTFTNNTASSSGGAIWLGAGSQSGNTFSGNVPNDVAP